MKGVVHITLTAIWEREGHLSPQLVLEEARSEASPLHDRFEWDDTAAGEKWRIHQAGQLIRSVKIKVESTDEDTPDMQVRAFVSVTPPASVIEEIEDATTSYWPADQLTEQMEHEVEQQMLRDWKYFKRRWSRYQSFWNMIRGDIADTG